MTERIDHAEKAMAFTGAEWRNGDVAVAQLMEAQVHATLALVEQQRIKNLLYIARETHADLMDGLESLGVTVGEMRGALGL